ncbi:DUF6218 family protein [Corynebacterium sp. YIM 101645]|uniref:DUF6218 family protein n=1 Tax=Corynebacterium lemuris TaxID=1859292 RepID=A0ABT2FVZ3_9CORY|nr:DUF6218 family protein [Corynebacterium lemuris]MCS5478222.1 DUF6218 family protein [Corynebacterium lemuris]
MSGHPVIAVVDRQEETTVVWQVQTAPDSPSGIMSGAWLLGPGEVDPARMADLTAGAHVLDVDGDGEALRAIRVGVEKRLAEYKAAAKTAKEANPQLTLPRFDAPETVDLEQIATAYHGEPTGQRAWTYATALTELVEAWHTIESQRRSRKYLQERYGAEALPLPLD